MIILGFSDNLWYNKTKLTEMRKLMRPLLKWPGGKAREIAQIYGMIPDFDRYIEPFFGGGALYFHLMPERAAINDTAADLMEFYHLVRMGDEEFRKCLTCYAESFRALLDYGRLHVTELLDVWSLLPNEEDAADSLSMLMEVWMPEIEAMFCHPIVLDTEKFRKELEDSLLDKLVRTKKNHVKKPFSPKDLAENLVTGLTSGYYLYFRSVYNDWNLGRITLTPGARTANFFFIRENCYGSMFRYNRNGEFNIPYGGMSYNDKDFQNKVDALFREETAKLFSGTDIQCMDFEKFIDEQTLTEHDFMFLDPPYDTEFSDYEGKAFTKLDQARLAVILSKTKAKFLLIIKNTPYIEDLYSKGFYIKRFDKQYTYNVRSRNDRAAEHLIITNYPTE